MTKDTYLAPQSGLFKKSTLRRASGIVEVSTGPVSPSKSIQLRIVKEIEPGAVGLFPIGAVMTLQTGGDVKC